MRFAIYEDREHFAIPARLLVAPSPFPLDDDFAEDGDLDDAEDQDEFDGYDADREE